MRCPLLLPSQLSAEQQPLYKDMLAGIGSDFKPVFEAQTPEGQLIGPWGAWLQEPAIGGAIWELVKVMTAQATLKPVVRQVAILTVGGHFNAGYEMYAHGALAKAGGMSEETLSTILGGSRPCSLTEEEACAYDTAKALTRGGILPEASYKRAVEVFGQHGAHELIYLVGLYHLVSVTLNGFNVPVPGSQLPHLETSFLPSVLMENIVYVTPDEKSQLFALNAMDSSATIHKRIYQACDNCRAKRVRCHLGSVDQPQNPPCARCKRENKECIFSSTRKRRAKIEHDHHGIPQNKVEMTITADVSMQYDYSPPSGDGNQTESSDGQHTVSALLDREAYTSNDALEVLHEAFQHGGNPITNHSTSSGSGNESGNRSRNETVKNEIALKTWNSLRFVRTGLFTAGEALAYVTWFYTHLVPFSPVPSLRFKDPLQHSKLVEEEPVLALTILTLASRYVKLKGSGAVTRGNIIHDRLWNYLRGMITRVFWSEENFVEENTTSPATTQRSVLRNVGTCEALLLLLEWYPRTLHFPPVDRDTTSITVKDGNESISHVATETRYGRKRSGVDWLSRSDRMCWSLLGLAQSLAVELGLFEKEEIMRSQEDIERAHRIQQLLWVFLIQTSGRLGWKYLPTLSVKKQTPSATLDDSTRCWVVSKLMRWILAVEYEYVRVYVYSIVLQAVVERRRKEKASPGDQILRMDGQREDTDELYDGLYLGYLTDAARSLLRVVVDDIFPEGCLLYVPVRTYSRILSAALYLLKTCAIEAKDSEARKSLDLVVRTAGALQSSVVDDVHLSPHWGELLASLCSSLSSRTTQSVTTSSGSLMTQQLPLNTEVQRNQSTSQNSFDAERQSNLSSSNPAHSISPISTQTGILNSAYDPTYVHDLGTIQSSMGLDPQINYDDIFSWGDPMGGMDITHMPWNGDHAIYDILASVADSENQ
ncbi:hypothetical protein G7Y89_g7235 [Cudoniella acicularis]|uniref:Zn(2)-C6 fungal-type domain-containing protein n=1 Tax=Cudoniella acicularis TaxID=354080 RepID=A0A8H4W409_9HELO|nr:hypothetical protein G7Y89_g7235 [Cudoniella acicularis]